MATTKFESHAAMLTLRASFFGFLNAYLFISTDLLQPNLKKAIIKAPAISTCFNGSKVNSPLNLGDLSPNLSAILARVYSFTEKAINIAGILRNASNKNCIIKTSLFCILNYTINFLNLLFSKLNNLLILIFISEYFSTNKIIYFSKHLKIEVPFLLI